MARDKADRSATGNALTSRSAESLDWRSHKVAEDELSVMYVERANIETAEQAREAAMMLTADDFSPFIENLAEVCDKTLGDHGFPRAAEMVRHDGAGAWWRHPPDAPKRPQVGETWKYMLGSKLVELYADDFSDPWYAARIGLKCRLVLEHLRKGDGGKSFLFRMIYQIGCLNTDWTWRRTQKPSILTGRKQRAVLSEYRNAAHTRARSVMEERRAAIRELLGQTQLTGGALVKHLKRHLETDPKMRASTRTIRRDLAALRET